MHILHNLSSSMERSSIFSQEKPQQEKDTARTGRHVCALVSKQDGRPCSSKNYNYYVVIEYEYSE